ncbi:mutator-like element transposase [Purpureocillium lilacinum]|uniref:Mutator-like element transposase n=1 Tax=Purpureocillium lilacinum TaxID=33203 RepID=A0A179F3U6_PURLI|nr:mutator-like element transposase [Purpureocillium lilacinum]
MSLPAIRRFARGTTGQWPSRRKSATQCAVHNHEPSPHISAHPSLHALSASDEATISDLTQASIAPRDISTYLRQNSSSGGVATQQDIYNCIAKSKRALCEGQSTIQDLANELDGQGFWSRIQLDQARRVTAVLLAHPESLAYLQAYPELLILDCTYKTNKYKMPLLDMIGVDAYQRSFCIAFAFLSGEAEEDFIWALDRLRSMYDMCGASYPSVVLTDRCLACMNAVAHCFPGSISLLCLWHANKAVLASCRPAFVRREGDEQSIERRTEFFGYWFAIVNSIDEEAYNRQLDELERRYVPEYVDEVSYIKQTWLDLYKEKLVKAWVDQHAHFGNNVTSRVQGIHALLKGHLKSSQQDLFTQIRTPLDLSGPLFGAIRGWVSHEALRKVDQQRSRLEGNNTACTGAFTRTQGLPCAHTLRPLVEGCLPLQLHHFHPHWLLYHGSEKPELITEPRRQFDTLTGRSASAHASTRREPSLFEVTEKARPKAKTAPTCSRCHTKGHTMTSRVCPLRHSELIEQVVARATCVETAETAHPTEATRIAVIEEAIENEAAAQTTHDARDAPSTAIGEGVQSAEATRSTRIMEAAPILEAARIGEDRP